MAGETSDTRFSILSTSGEEYELTGLFPGHSRELLQEEDPCRTRIARISRHSRRHSSTSHLMVGLRRSTSTILTTITTASPVRIIRILSRLPRRHQFSRVARSHGLELRQFPRRLVGVSRSEERRVGKSVD